MAALSLWVACKDRALCKSGLLVRETQQSFGHPCSSGWRSAHHPLENAQTSRLRKDPSKAHCNSEKVGTRDKTFRRDQNPVARELEAVKTVFARKKNTLNQGTLEKLRVLVFPELHGHLIAGKVFFRSSNPIIRLLVLETHRFLTKIVL